jgi:hypothetical protein
MDWAQFELDARALVTHSPYGRRILQLLLDPLEGTVSYTADRKKSYYGEPSNCAGTLLYVLGLYGNEYGKPAFVEPDLMKDFLKCNGTRILSPAPGSVAVFSDSKYAMGHFAYCLGGEKTIVFHQPSTGEPFALDPLSTYPSWFPTIHTPRFYALQENTVLPSSIKREATLAKQLKRRLREYLSIRVARLDRLCS